MQSVYKSDVRVDRNMLEELSLKFETDRRKAEIEGDVDLRKGLQDAVEEKEKHLELLRRKIDSRVLDAEIFFRNAKM